MSDQIYSFYPVKRVGDPRGSLEVIEASDAPRKVFLRTYLMRIRGVGQIRGKHAHRRTFQVAYCIRGSAKFKFTDGLRSGEVVLDSSSDAVTLEPLVWHSIESLSDECEIIVMADSFYDESDYIRSFDEFLSVVS